MTELLVYFARTFLIMFVVLFAILFIGYWLLLGNPFGKKTYKNEGSTTNIYDKNKNDIFLNPARQAEYDIQKKRESEINQQQQKEFEKVARKYSSKKTEKEKKSELDKNFAETGKYESDKSKKSRLDKELKVANARKKYRWIPFDQHRGDWNDK